MTGLIIVVTILIIIAWGVSSYNKLIAFKNKVINTFANIDIILKQRADQIPQLIAVVEKTMEHEHALFTQLSDARQAYFHAKTINDKITISNDMSKMLGSVMALAENYPTLISGDNFIELQNSVSAIEEKIANRREMFNDATTNYNTAIHLFPDLILAKIFNYQDLPLLKITENEATYNGIKFKK